MHLPTQSKPAARDVRRRPRRAVASNRRSVFPLQEEDYDDSEASDSDEGNESEDFGE
jgi:hypothetical protein